MQIYLWLENMQVQFSSVAQSCPILCNPMDCSTPDLPVHHKLPEPQKIKSDTVSTVSPSITHEAMGPDAMIFVFWMLSFKPTFSLSSFIFIKRLFSSSSLSAIRVVSSAHLKLLIFLLQSWFQLVLQSAFPSPQTVPLVFGKMTVECIWFPLRNY